MRMRTGGDDRGGGMLGMRPKMELVTDGGRDGGAERMGICQRDAKGERDHRQ